MEYSVCGIDCSGCRFKKEHACEGCRTMCGNIFWGECTLYRCNEAKKQEDCGRCAQFPCQTLQQWASKENPERIDNLRKMRDRE